MDWLFIVQLRKLLMISVSKGNFWRCTGKCEASLLTVLSPALHICWLICLTTYTDRSRCICRSWAIIDLY